MLDENKIIDDIRQFVAARIAKGRILDVDAIGLQFMCISDAAQGEAYKGLSVATIEPFVKIVVAEHLRRGRSEQGIVFRLAE